MRRLSRMMKADRLSIVKKIAKQYADDFKAFSGAADQRSARRGLLAKIIGK